MKTTFRIQGLKELERALSELPKATGKNVLRRVLRKAAEPMARDMKAMAPIDEGHLVRSIGVGTRLTRRQSREHRKMFRDDRAAVEMFVGAGGLVQAITQEFGTVDHPPQPFARPAWDANKRPVLDSISTDLEKEIMSAAKRLAKKQARLAAKAAKG